MASNQNAADALDGKSVLAKVSGSEGSRFGAEYVVLDPAAANLIGMNASAGRVWAMIDGGASLAEIGRRLAAEFDIDAAQASADVLSFARELLERGLVRMVS